MLHVTYVCVVSIISVSCNVMCANFTAVPYLHATALLPASIYLSFLQFLVFGFWFVFVLRFCFVSFLVLVLRLHTVDYPPPFYTRPLLHTRLRLIYVTLPTVLL